MKVDFSEKTIKKDMIYSGKIIEVNLQTVVLPNGRKSKREVVNHPGGVAILAYKDSDTVFMVEQFRKPIERNILEIPAGKIEKDEDIKTCGMREFEEEIGYKARKFEYIGKVVTSPGFCDEYIYIFKAEDLYKGRDDIGDEDEFINIKEVKIGEIKDMIKNGEIIDAKTICAFMMI